MGTGTTSDADWACQGDETNVHFFQIIEGNYRLGYIQRSFKQRASMGTGTTSDADWACHDNEKNVHRRSIVNFTAKSDQQKVMNYPQ